MADFRFTMDINANYSSIDQARQQMAILNTEINRATNGQHNVNVGTADIQEAKMYMEALQRAINKVSVSGGNLDEEIGKAFEEIRREAGLAEQQTEQLRRELERLRAASDAGAGGIRKVSNAAKVATQDIRRTSTQLERLQVNMREGLGQTLAFGAITGVVTAVASAVNEVRELDKVMTNISIVSSKTASEMEAYRDASFETAKALGTTAEEYMNASLIYEQQGGQAADYATQLAESTVIAANVTGRSTQEMSEYLTATINGFKMFDEYGAGAGTKVVDVYSKLGAVSGSGLDEMAEALQRTATVAKNSGYDFEQISAAVATVSETTRRSPEVIGSAFKSILLSFQQLREGSEEDLNQFTSKVEKAFQISGVEGISIFDNGQLREGKDIMDDIGEKWEDLNKESRAVISESIAGKEQAETFQAFMDNQERYATLVGEAYDSAGTAANQQIVYMDSIEAHVQELQNAWQKAASSIIDSDLFKGVLDQATRFLEVVGSQESAFESLLVTLGPVVGIFGQLFGGKAVKNMFQNNFNENMSKNLIKQLESSGQLTDSMREQLTVAEEQQNVMRNLGEQAGAAYKKNREEIEALNEELRVSEQLQENIGETAGQVDAQLKSGGGVQGISTGKVNEKGKEKVQEAVDSGAIQAHVQEAEDLAARAEILANNVESLAQTSLATSNMDINEARIGLQNVSNAIADSGLELHEVQALQNRIDEAINNQEASYEDLHNILSSVDEDLAEIYVTQQNIADGSETTYTNQIEEAARLAEIQAQLQAGNRSADAIQEDITLAEQQNELMEQGAQKAKLMGMATEALSGAFGVATSMYGAYNAVQEGSITSGEAAQQTMQSLGTTAMLIPHPIGKVIGGLLLLIGTFGDFTSEADKVKEANEDMIRSFSSLNEQVTGAMAGLSSNKDALEAFQGMDAETLLSGDAISGDQEKSEKLKQDYLALAQAIEQTSPELVKYYDLEGNAVIDLNAKYDDMMKNKAVSLAENNKMMVANQSSFIAQYSSEMAKASSSAEEANTKLLKAQSELTKAKNEGDGEAVDASLKTIQELNSELTKAKDSLNTAKGGVSTNIIQPIIQANEELQKLSVESPKIAGKIKSAMSDIIPQDMIQSLMMKGNDKQAQVMLDNAAKIGDAFTAMGKEGVTAIEEFSKNLEGANVLTKHLAFSMENATAEEVTKALSSNAADLVLASKGLGAYTDGASEEMKNMLDYSEGIAKITSKDLNWKDAFDITGSDTRKGINESQEAEIEAHEDELKRIRAEKDARGEAYTQLILEKEAAAAVQEKYGKLFAEDGVRAIEIVETEIEQTNAKNEAYHELVNTMSELSSTTEGYNSIVEAMADNDSLLENLESLKENPLKGEDLYDTDSFKQIEKDFPNLVDEMKKQVKAGQDVNEIIAAQRREIEITNKAYQQGLAMNSETYYKEYVGKHSEMLNQAAEFYGVDYRNFATMQEYKLALQAMSVSEFGNFEEMKAIAAARGNKSQMDGDTAKNQGMMANLGTTINTSLSGFNYLSSNSLTVSDKIQVAFLSIVDVVTGAVAALTQLIWGMLTGIVESFGAMIDELVEIANVIPGVDIDSPVQEKFKSGMDSGKDMFSLQSGTTFAADFGASQSKKNEEAKEFIINEQLTGYDMEIGGKLNLDSPTAKKLDKNLPTNSAEEAYDKLYPDKDKDKSGNKSSKDKDKEKDVEDLDLELDRYYKLENAMTVIEDKLDSISNKKDEAYGSKKISFMEQEQRQYAAQTKTLNSYVTALKKEQAEKRKLLTGNGFNIGSGGEISNLNQRLTALQNAANKKSGEAKEKAIDRVKELQEEAERYTELTYNLIPDKKKALEEAKSAIKALEREKIEYRVELKIQKVEYLEEVRDTIKEINGEEFTRLDENLAVTGQSIKSNIDLYNYYQKKVKEVQGNRNLTDSDRNELLQDYKSEMLSAATAAKDSYEELSEYQQAFVDQSSEMIDKVMEGFDRIKDKASSLADVYDDVYGSQGYEKVRDIRQIEINAIDEQLQATVKLKSQMELYQATLKEGSEAWESANETIVGLGDTIQENLIERIEKLQEAFEKFKENLLETSEKSVFGTLGIEDFEEQMNRVLSTNDAMMNSYEKITKIGGLMSEVNDSIRDSLDPNDAAAYQKFKERELQTLMNSDEVSEKQFERAKLLWEIEQKKQALEDRKNSKTSAQLVRDENGNMVYEYNTEQTESDSSSKKALAEAQNSLKEFDDAQTQAAAKNVLSIVKDVNKKIDEIYDDKSLSEAERKVLLERTLQQAQDDISKAQQEMIQWSGHGMSDGMKALETSFKNGTSLNSIGIEDKLASKIFDALNSGELSNEDFLSNDVDKVSSSLGLSVEEAASAISALLKATGDESTMMTAQMLELSNNWLVTTQNNLTTLETQYTTSQSQIQSTTDLLTSSTGNLNAQIDQTGLLADKTASKITSQANAMTAATKTTTAATSAYLKLKNQLVGKSGNSGTLGAMIDLKDTMNKKLSPATKTVTKTQAALRSQAIKTSHSLEDLAEDANTAYKKEKQFDSKTIVTANKNVKTFGTYSKTSGTQVQDLGNKSDESRKKIASLSVALAGLPGLDSGKMYYYTKTGKDGSVTTAKYKDKQKSSSNMEFVGYFDTGGYTGDWAGSSGNQEGKAAILHEKEIVLNKDDTKNFLEGIKLQRQVLQQTGGMQSSVASMINGGVGRGSDSIEQNINIQASFPGATNSQEIENAFNSLSLRAQSHAFSRANRK